MAERINFKQATIAQLRAYGETLGIYFDDGANRMKMVAQLKTARPGEASFVLAGTAETPMPDIGGQEFRAPLPEAAKSPSDKIRILVHRTEAVDGDEPVSVGVNGRTMRIPRGEPVWVPRPYVEVLEHSERIIYDQINLPDGQMELRPRKVPGIPFSMA